MKTSNEGKVLSVATKFSALTILGQLHFIKLIGSVVFTTAPLQKLGKKNKLDGGKIDNGMTHSDG